MTTLTNGAAGRPDAGGRAAREPAFVLDTSAGPAVPAPIAVATGGLLGRAVSSIALPRLPGLSLGFLWRLLQSLAFRSLRRAVGRALGFLVRLAISTAAALTIGLGSVWYMVDVGSPLTVVTSGPWRLWPAAGRPDADPYTRAHFARLGWLPLSTHEALSLVATADSEGQRLYADCEYDVAGPLIAADWWSLSVYDAGGALLDVPAERHVLSRATVVPDGAGRVTIRLAADARPGNWLPTLGGSLMTLVLRVHRPTLAPGQSDPSLDRLPTLPAITRVACR